jgi:hypothetical protein
MSIPRYVVREDVYFRVIDLTTGREMGDGFWTRAGADALARRLNNEQRREIDAEAQTRRSSGARTDEAQPVATDHRQGEAT